MGASQNAVLKFYCDPSSVLVPGRLKNFQIQTGMEYVDLEEMKGGIVTAIWGDDAVLYFLMQDQIFRMIHINDCCESVSLVDICGDLDDLIGHPILLAEEVTCENETPDGMPSYIGRPELGAESYTWTFYKLATIKGSVTITWYGESNGCYSETVSVQKCAVMIGERGVPLIRYSQDCGF